MLNKTLYAGRTLRLAKRNEELVAWAEGIGGAVLFALFSLILLASVTPELFVGE